MVNPKTGKSIPTFEAKGQSEVFLEFQERLSRAAPVNRPVLLVGERGTGKELAATRLHYLSLRWQGPFITLNCAALAPSLIESELFGYERGAFTGAHQRRIGRFESAHTGTLFLDEIGAIPMEVQEKILRVVEYGVFERVGSSEPVEADVRIIGATNADLMDLTKKGLFKRDLLDRLSFEVLFLPPLRERKGDILYLANHFAQRMAYELGKEEIPEFSDDAANALENHTWKGNIRELKNVVERAVYRSVSDLITEIVFNPFHPTSVTESQIQPVEAKADSPATPAHLIDLMNMPLKEAVERLETGMLRKALEKTRYNQRKASRILGLTYDQFRGLRRKYSEKIM
jgi:psp operon transcriptional activator